MEGELKAWILLRKNAIQEEMLKYERLESEAGRPIPELAGQKGQLQELVNIERKIDMIKVGNLI